MAPKLVRHVGNADIDLSKRIDELHSWREPSRAGTVCARYEAARRVSNADELRARCTVKTKQLHGGTMRPLTFGISTMLRSFNVKIRPFTSTVMPPENHRESDLAQISYSTEKITLVNRVMV